MEFSSLTDDAIDHLMEAARRLERGMMVEGVLIPAGGASSRMRSVTGGTHKALLRLGGRPIIDHVMDEIVAAGFRRVTVVVPAAEDGLKAHLTTSASHWRGVHLSVLSQRGAGACSAILEGARYMGCGRLLVVWCDEVFKGTNRAAEVVRASEQTGALTVALHRVPAASRPLCGMADALRLPDYDRYYKVAGICEKPAEDAWSGDLASVGGYVISEHVLEVLEGLCREGPGEIPLSAALDAVAKHSIVVGVEIMGEWFDCGSPAGYQRAVTAFGRG